MARNQDNIRQITTDQPAPPDISELDLITIYSNRYFVWANTEIVQFIFGAAVAGGEPTYKSSFVMTRTDAASFAKMIIDMLASTDPTKPK